MKKFNYLNNAELLEEIDRYSKIIKKFQDPIDNYDLHYDNFLNAKKNNDFSQNNPIICSTQLITKETANGSYYIKGLGEEHFEVIDRNKHENYQRQKIHNLEDKVKQLQRSIERIHEILAKITFPNKS